MLSSPIASQWFLGRADLDTLVQALRADGRRVIGPTVADGAIVYDEIGSAAELPSGWTDTQAPGRYRAAETGGDRVFDHTAGPTSWKRFTFPPVLELTVSHGEDFGFEQPAREIPPMAFLGVRACELAALGLQDRVFLGGQFTDEDYRGRRNAALVVAVQCSRANATCFCTSMGTGPEVRAGYDLLLTELAEGFVVEAGSPAGTAILQRLPARRATHAEMGAAVDSVEACRASMGEPLPMAGIHERLLAQLDNPRWAEVAERCLDCGNCTLSCPTCFCTATVERSDLDGRTSTSERLWDSCFDAGFARVAGGDFRSRSRDRYRQWLTHKFGTWMDQFSSLGCVGCGRCVTWCPVGIDVREELMAIAPPLAPTVEPEPVRPAAASPGAYSVARVSAVRLETSDTATLSLTDLDPAFLAGRPGQFAMVALPAFPAVPISISRYRPNGIDLTIRAAGPTTTALVNLKRGAKVGVRGPLGTWWPIEQAYGRHAVVVAGGVGLPPLRGLVDQLLAERERFSSVALFYGARTPADQVFADELKALAARDDIQVALTVDRAGPDWKGRVGVVTQLFDQVNCDCGRMTAFVCGPERMMQATVQTLIGRGVAPERIFVSLERHMECGIGLCGHCQMGRFFVCKDGPVFRLTQLGDTFNREGI
ncbi:MAG TPA: 4Fe-4S dicluster domain-containing protein [Candidatus Limnocylindrales bacterium]